METPKRIYTVITSTGNGVEVHKKDCADVTKKIKQNQSEKIGTLATRKGVEGVINYYFDFDVAYKALPCCDDAPIKE